MAERDCKRDYVAEMQRALAGMKVPDNDYVAEIKRALDWSPPELRGIIIGYRSDIDVTHYRIFRFLCDKLVHDWRDYKYSALLRSTKAFIENIVTEINTHGCDFDIALESCIWAELRNFTPDAVTIANSDSDSDGSDGDIDDATADRKRCERNMKFDLHLAILFDMKVLAPFNPLANTGCGCFDELPCEFESLQFELNNTHEYMVLHAKAAIAAADAVQARKPDSAWRFMKEFYAYKLVDPPRLIDLARLWKIAHETRAVVCNYDGCPYAADRSVRNMLVELFPTELAAEEKAAAAKVAAAAKTAAVIAASRLSDDDFDEVMAGL